MSEIPTQLETLEDFTKTCELFLAPFIEERMKGLANVIKSLHEKMETGKLLEEDVNLHMNQIAELTSFASESNPMAPYLQNIIELERKLINSGELNYETE